MRVEVHTGLAGMTAKRPAAPLVRDEEAVPVAWPIGWSKAGTYGHSRTAQCVASPATGRLTRCAYRPS